MSRFGPTTIEGKRCAPRHLTGPSPSANGQFPDKKSDGALLIPLLGIAGETETLLSEFKKKIRDKESYDGFKERAEEELGDVLWYLSNIASRLDLSLSAIATKNLHKTQERWPIAGEQSELFHH